MGRPKALLRWGGMCFLERVLELARSCSLEDPVVVLGEHRDEILSEVGLDHGVFNPQYATGMTSSFQAGIRALPAEARGAAIFLVDHPFVSGATVETLLDRFEEKPILVPVYQGRRGHPVVFSRPVLDEILALPLDRGVHTVVRRDPPRVLEVAVEDPGVLADIDTPQEFERWKASHGS